MYPTPQDIQQESKYWIYNKKISLIYEKLQNEGAE